MKIFNPMCLLPLCKVKNAGYPKIEAKEIHVDYWAQNSVDTINTSGTIPNLSKFLKLQI